MKPPKPLVFAVVCILMLALSPCIFAQGSKFDGRPLFSEGTDLGYYLWRDGDTWKVRWTTKGNMRNFSGSVESVGGKLKSLKRIDVESERKVLYPGRPAAVWVGPRGRVHARGGRAPVVVENKQDKIDKDGDYRIVFTARTNNDIDGFEFKLGDGVTSLRFVLQIDGRSMPRLVEIGAGNVKALQLPLIVTLP
jgi:hypothetical protein